MFPYYITYIIMILSAVFLEAAREKRLLKREISRKIYCILFAVIWILLLGLRHPSMGVDLGYGTNNGYWINYIHIGRLPWKYVLLRPFQNYEIGYRILNKFAYSICSDPQLLLFICAFASFAAISRMIDRYSDFPFLSSIIYLGLTVFQANFSAMRQTAAIAITIFSFDFIREKKLTKFILTVLAASMFHYTAILFLAAYPIYHLKMGQKTIWISIFAIPVLYVIKTPVFTILSRIVKDEVAVSATSSGMLFFAFCIVYIFSVVFMCAEDSEESGLRNLFYCAVLCQIFGSIYGTAMRVGWYFMPYLILLLPKIIRNNSLKTKEFARRNSVIMYVVFFVCFSLFGLHLLSGHGWAQSNPYHFLWQKCYL